MFLLDACVCGTDSRVIKVTDSIYVLKGAGSTSKLREKLARRSGSNNVFNNRAALTVNLSDPCSVMLPGTQTFYLVPVYFPFISLSRLVALLDRLPTGGQLVSLTLTGKDRTSEYLFICALVNFIRDKFPTHSVDSAAFEFLDGQAMHRSVFRMSDTVRLLANARLRHDGNSIVQLNHVIISGVPLNRGRVDVALQLAPGTFGTSLVRYFDSAGNVTLTLQMRASESFLISVSVGGVSIVAYELVGLALFQNSFQVISKADLNPKLELLFPLPDSFTLTLVGEVLQGGRPAQGATATGSASRASESEKRQLVLTALPEFAARRGETSEECQICLENVREGDTMIIFPCLHHFHKHCVEAWTHHKLLCPNCRCDAYELLLRVRES